ncbi:MAG: phosphoribosylamine--glycine ligase [Rhodobacteraceae bacterium]|nr:phosphoribosylamine--glycine ligase [Paracoccaceae bacterium]
MKILILGGGGREHALAWAISQNPKCTALLCAPGNAGIADVAECIALDIEDGAAVAAFATAQKVDFVVIGPEGPLAVGVADAVRGAGIICFGPGADAAHLESSKSFTKEICAACGAPTADSAFFTDLEKARAHINATGAPIVIKADGLAAGKGVTVAMELSEALAAVEDIFDAHGAAVLIEEFMEGEEASFFVLSDGKTALPMGSAQDHKRAFDGDKGPNTGGMGAYSPAPVMTPAVTQKAMDEIVQPTLDEMAKRGTPFQGVLFVGLMIKNGQPRLIEYNVRFGDPEIQAIAMRLGGQVLDLLLATAEGTLADATVNWADDHALAIVMAAKGYPGTYAKGDTIGGLGERSPQVKVFHAGTAKSGDDIVSNGGRVLAITARGETLKDAHARAYARLKRINWPNGFARSDIGWRAL